MRRTTEKVIIVTRPQLKYVGLKCVHCSFIIMLVWYHTILFENGIKNHLHLFCFRSVELLWLLLLAVLLGMFIAFIKFCICSCYHRSIRRIERKNLEMHVHKYGEPEETLV